MKKVNKIKIIVIGNLIIILVFFKVFAISKIELFKIVSLLLVYYIKA
ncbi:putative hypothetical protein [Clostridium botulinum BKT015925]|nr:putative hypothetical protein [Clostridium botulinum BKT015925]